MNIFMLDDDMQICAEYHCDKHVGKMLLESVQILCTVLHQQSYENLPYKPTHANHPCTKWAGYSTGNFKQLTLLATKLANEFEYRFGKRHKSAEALKQVLIMTNMNSDLPMDDHIASRPMMAMPDKYKGMDHVAAYREYYRSKLAQWGEMRYTNRDIPEFLIGE